MFAAAGSFTAPLLRPLGIWLNIYPAKGYSATLRLKRPEDAKLHLGIAQLVAGDKSKAQATFKTVQGTDGTADLARLWALYARRGTA